MNESVFSQRPLAFSVLVQLTCQQLYVVILATKQFKDVQTLAPVWLPQWPTSRRQIYLIFMLLNKIKLTKTVRTFRNQLTASTTFVSSLAAVTSLYCVTSFECGIVTSSSTTAFLSTKYVKYYLLLITLIVKKSLKTTPHEITSKITTTLTGNLIKNS
jgi:hypothetical protein